MKKIPNKKTQEDRGFLQSFNNVYQVTYKKIKQKNYFQSTFCFIRLPLESSSSILQYRVYLASNFEKKSILSVSGIKLTVYSQFSMINHGPPWSLQRCKYVGNIMRMVCPLYLGSRPLVPVHPLSKRAVHCDTCHRIMDSLQTYNDVYYKLLMFMYDVNIKIHL